MVGIVPGGIVRGRGFTLVELLVVITIIGMPRRVAVAGGPGRAGKRAAIPVRQHFHNIGLASWPTKRASAITRRADGDGTGSAIADRGFGANQCGGWIYSILPYVDNAALHDMGAGGDTTAKKQATVKMLQTPVSIMNCPTRRRSPLYPPKQDPVANNAGGIRVGDFAGTQGIARTDYAACAGDAQFDEQDAGPSSIPARSASAFRRVKWA